MDRKKQKEKIANGTSFWRLLVEKIVGARHSHLKDDFVSTHLATVQRPTLQDVNVINTITICLFETTSITKQVVVERSVWVLSSQFCGEWSVVHCWAVAEQVYDSLPHAPGGREEGVDFGRNVWTWLAMPCVSYLTQATDAIVFTASDVLC